MRFKLPAGGDVPIDVAARRMGMTRQAFGQALPLLIGRGFPAPDATTGNFDLEAIDAWRKSRHPQIFPSDRLLVGPTAKDANSDFANRLTRFRGG